MQTEENKEVVEETVVETEQTQASDDNQQTEFTEQDEKDVKIEELQNRILRLQADFDNFRRRNTSEREQLSTFVTADVVGKFLKVLDNFERAEGSMKKTSDVASITSGMEMIRRQLEQVFQELGVSEIPSEGKTFDPEVHEAVMRSENPELADDTIDAVFEKGYKLRDKVIRHSKVKVVSNS